MSSTDIDFDNLEVVNNTEAKRFEIKLGDDLAMAEYMLGGGKIIFTHTEVPPAYEGKGIANKLARTALEHARAEGLRVVAMCPFFSLYIRKHPEYRSLVWGG
jgi:uncharacterized protein